MNQSHTQFQCLIKIITNWKWDTHREKSWWPFRWNVLLTSTGQWIGTFCNLIVQVIVMIESDRSRRCNFHISHRGRCNEWQWGTWNGCDCFAQTALIHNFGAQIDLIDVMREFFIDNAWLMLLIGVATVPNAWNCHRIRFDFCYSWRLRWCVSIATTE